MKRASLLLAAAFAALLAAFLPRMAGAQTGPKCSVTIFTDGMNAPNGPMTRALTELSVVDRNPKDERPGKVSNEERCEQCARHQKGIAKSRQVYQ